MALLFKTLTTAAVLAAAVISLASATVSFQCPSSYNAHIFQDDVQWGCSEPFDCFVEFCDCVDGPLASSCSPFSSNITAAQLEQCTARRVTCILNSALHARGVLNQTCRHWGDNLVKAYHDYYYDHTNTNLTNACEASMCSLMQQGASSLVSSVNLTYVCSLVNFSWPTPLQEGEVPGCPLLSQSLGYFDQIPFDGCPGNVQCMQNFCTCINGTWNATMAKCSREGPDDAATGKRCLATGLSCFVNSALAVYSPGASPLNADPCVGWSVPIAQAYSQYYSATNKMDTDFYRTCNFTACSLIFGGMADTNFSSVCAFNDVTARPTFAPFDACPFACPDGPCSFGVAGCNCTRFTHLDNLHAEFLYPIGSTFDVTKQFMATAYADYGVPSGNCSTYNFGSSLTFSWSLSFNSTVAVINASSVEIVPHSLSPGTVYTLNVTVYGIFPWQTLNHSWTFTAVAPPPVVSITDLGSSMRVSNLATTTITARVVDIVGSDNYQWSCTVVSGSNACPDITNATKSTLIIPAGSLAGTFHITYTYTRGSAVSSTLELTITSDMIPIVEIVIANIPLSDSPLAFLSLQQIIAAVVVDFDGNYTVNWTTNSGPSVGTNEVLALNASSLMTTTLANIQGSSYTWNTISVKVTSSANTTVYGEASIDVIVVEPITVGLTVAKQGGGSSAVGITDNLVFTPTAAGSSSLDSSNAPFGASLQYGFSFVDAVGGVQTSIGIITSPAGSTFIGQAPLFSDSSVSFKNTTFNVFLRIDGVDAGFATAYFNVTAPNIGAATSAMLSQLDGTKDPLQTVNAVNNIRALMAQSTNATLIGQMATKAMDALFSNVGNTTLTSDQQVSVFAALNSALGVSTSNKSQQAEFSAKAASIIASSLNSSSFDTKNAATVVSALANMDASNGGKTSIMLAVVLSNDPNQPLGEAKVISVGGIQVVAYRQSAGSISGSEVGATGGAKLAIPTGLSIPGLSATDVVGFASTTLANNPYSGSTTGSVITYDISANGKKLSIANLNDDLVITLPDGSGVCMYWSTTFSQWIKVPTRVKNGKVQCLTNHLTAFGSFASSSAGVALSLFVVLVAALLQLVVF